MIQPSPSVNPSRLGRYEIVDELGKGAMGVVYLARDPLIGRLVALKTFRTGYSVRDHEMEQFRARFIREAQSAGILSHPGIVTIHDVVEQSADGLAFIAMEYVRGTNLKVILQREGPLALERAAGIVEQVADALDYAHSRGVVHRDIKPANILLTADGRVKITDFGIARLDTSNLTQEGQLLGTPNYMAPEQILGKEVDHRADVFSLGIVLYEMLTRHKPFQGDNLTVVSHRIVYDQFTPPRQYVEDLPPGVERVLTRALEKDPANRYQRARELAGDLKQVASPVPAGEALNETLNLSATAMVPLPTLPETAPPPRGPGRGAQLFAALSAQLSAALAQRPPWERLATVAFCAAGAAVLVGALALLSLGWGTAVPPTAQEQARGVVLARLGEGQKWVRLARYPEAIQAFREAERLAPGLPAPRRLREYAEGLAGAGSRMQSAGRQVSDRLEDARLAMTQRQYEEAAEAASDVLALDADNTEAKQIFQRAKQEISGGPVGPKLTTRASSRPSTRAGGAAVAEASPDPAAQREAAEPAPEPVPAEAMLAYRFDTALPKGTFRITIDGQNVVNEPFNFFEGRFLRRQARPGFLQGKLNVPAGAKSLLIYVVPEGRKAETASFAQPHDIALSHGRIAIVLKKDGELSAFPERQSQP